MSEPKRYRVIGNDGLVHYANGSPLPVRHYFDIGDVVRVPSSWTRDPLSVNRERDGKWQLVARADLEELP